MNENAKNNKKLKFFWIYLFKILFKFKILEFYILNENEDFYLL
jgi:hypothetical protein